MRGGVVTANHIMWLSHDLPSPFSRCRQCGGWHLRRRGRSPPAEWRILRDYAPRVSLDLLEPQHYRRHQLVVGVTTLSLFPVTEEMSRCPIGRPTRHTWTSTTWIESQHPLIFSVSPAFLMRKTPAKPWSKSHKWTEHTPLSKYLGKQRGRKSYSETLWKGQVN